jgi:hypothetical protein
MQRPSRPEALSVVAFAVGWVGVYFAFRDNWLGILLPLLTTVLTLLVVRRVEALGRDRRQELQRALESAAARNRELERLRHLAATLLAGTDLTGVVEEVSSAAAELLQAESGVVTFAVEEGRFLRVAAATGPMSLMRGRLIPVDGSMVGWVMTHGTPLLSDHMCSDRARFRCPS